MNPTYEYQVLTQKILEGKKKFDQRINDLARQGWRAVSISSNHSDLKVVLMEKEQGTRFS